MKPKDRIIVALDVDDPERAAVLVETLRDYVGGFKMGLKFTLRMFSMMVAPLGGEAAHENLRRVRRLFSLLDYELMFWDLKFNDVPSTIAGAAKAIQAMLPIHVWMFSVHASSGIEGMRAAVANRGQSMVFAATVLTSLEENSANLIFGGPPKDKVLQFALDAKLAGVDGIICSPQELELLGARKELKGLLKVTPGIRAMNSPPDDQKRTMTAAEAVRAGADYLVIGRPITTADSPKMAALEFGVEIASAFKKK